jgi:hypothetical protein
MPTNFAHCFLDIITFRLGYQKFCARRFLKMLTGVHKTWRMALALTLEGEHKAGNELLSHIMEVMEPGFHP